MDDNRARRSKRSRHSRSRDSPAPDSTKKRRKHRSISPDPEHKNVSNPSYQDLGEKSVISDDLLNCKFPRHEDQENGPARSSNSSINNKNNLKPSKCDKSKRNHKRRGRGQRKNAKSKNLPWVPPPLPEHLRQIPQVTKIGYPVLPGKTYSGPPLQNQFQNDGSFLEVFRQRMEAANASGGEKSMACTVELKSLAPAAVEMPVVTKRRMAKPLKTGIVEKAKKKVDACNLESKDKDSWSLYMKEVQKYRANKCVNTEAACRPLMK